MSTEREQKNLESSTETLRSRISDVKDAIAGLIRKLETDPHLHWPSFLDSYALISGQMNSLVKQLKHERTPQMKKYICLPLALAPDRDEELSKMTFGRVNAFSHDLVPDYLRTKPDPDVEAKHATYETRATAINQDAASKQLMVMEKIVTSTLKAINREKDEIESKAQQRAEIEETTDIQDTFALVAAIRSGKGLKVVNTAPPPPGGMMGGGMRGGIGGPVPMGGAGMAQQAQSPQGANKAPSAIKTNIKAANQVHPYARQ